MPINFKEFILKSNERIAMPLGVYAGLDLTGASVLEAVSNVQAQTEAVMALHERFNSKVLLTAMDLSTEAEAFGCEIRLSKAEIPTIIGRKVTNNEEIDQLAVPEVGTRRTKVHLQTTSDLRRLNPNIPILGGVIGPFSLACRIFGVSESLELSISDPDVLTKLLDKTTHFLTEYVNAFRKSGADGVIMAEPAAGLLSPRGLEKFSSQYIKQIIEKTQINDFQIVLHNCGAKLVHLPKILESNASILHFGAPMDIIAALQQVESRIIISGNLDPASVFFSSSREKVQAQTSNLLNLTSGYKNFVISSGCDLPLHTPLENLEAFFNAVGDDSH